MRPIVDAAVADDDEVLHAVSGHLAETYGATASAEREPRGGTGPRMRGVARRRPEVAAAVVEVHLNIQAVGAQDVDERVAVHVDERGRRAVEVDLGRVLEGPKRCGVPSPRERRGVVAREPPAAGDQEIARPVTVEVAQPNPGVGERNACRGRV